MTTGTIAYIALSNGLKFDEFEINNRHPNVSKIAIKAESGHVSVNIILLDAYTSQEARDIGNNIVSGLLDRLAFEFDIPIEEASVSNIHLPTDQSGNKFTVGRDLDLRWDICKSDIAPGKEQIEDLKQKLASESVIKDVLCLYRFSVNRKDCVTKFMFLYNILLSCNHDKQDHADDFIRMCVPSVQESRSPHTERCETVYTRLRNEVAHHRNTVGSRTNKEIADNVEAFQQIVKKAILSNLEDIV